MFKGEAEGRGKNQSSPIRWGVGLRKLTSNEGGGESHKNTTEP